MLQFFLPKVFRKAVKKMVTAAVQLGRAASTTLVNAYSFLHVLRVNTTIVYLLDEFFSNALTLS